MRLVYADAACPASVQPNFLRAAKPKGEDRPENAGLKTRDAPIKQTLRDKTSAARSSAHTRDEMLTTPRCSGAPVSSVTTGVEQRV